MKPKHTLITLGFTTFALMAFWGCRTESSTTPKDPKTEVTTPIVPPSSSQARAPSDDLPPVDLVGAIGGSRPVAVQTPPQYPEAGKRYPLLILLHGYNSDSEGQDRYLGLSRLALQRGYIFIAPNGSTALGKGSIPRMTTRFWNATPSCCDFTKTEVDDVRYLRDLIRQMTARYPVDPKRVYIFGHSNGAFMAHRLACEEAPRITAIAGLAGSLGPEVTTCQPKVPVAVLTIHGTWDPVIRFAGGQTSLNTPPYPSAETTIQHWAKVNGCQLTPNKGPSFSLLEGGSTPETTPIRYGACSPGGAAELWRIDRGGHIPSFDDNFIPKVLDFFDRHQRN